MLLFDAMGVVYAAKMQMYSVFVWIYQTNGPPPASGSSVLPSPWDLCTGFLKFGL